MQWVRLLIVLSILQFSGNYGQCVYENYSRAANCMGLKSYDNLSRQIRSLNLKNSCNFNVAKWKNFTNDFPSLEKIKFDTFCPNCLKIDEYFQGLSIEGRCLERGHPPNLDLSSITSEIAGIISLLVFLSILYLIRFIRKEILRHFFTNSYTIPVNFNASRNLS
jgi:hypothetical protein